MHSRPGLDHPTVSHPRLVAPQTPTLPPRRGLARGWLALVLGLALVSGAGAQSRMPAQANAYLLSAYRSDLNGAVYDVADDWYGDADKVQVIFFEVDADVSGPLYLGIYDAGMDATEMQGTPDDPGDMWYRVYGGAGAFTGSNSRNLTFYNTTTALQGSLLAEIAIGAGVSANAAYNDTWIYTPPLMPEQGELVGTKRIFKLVVVAGKNPDTNALTDPDTNATNDAINGDDFVNIYQVALSSANGGAPVELAGVRAFAYSLSLSLEGTATPAVGPVWNLYPFIPENTNNAWFVRPNSFDGDYRVGNANSTVNGFAWTLERWNGTAYSTSTFINVSGDVVNTPGTPTQQTGAVNGLAVNNAAFTGKTWRFTMRGGWETGNTINGVDIWATVDPSAANLAPTDSIHPGGGTPIRIYAAPYAPQAPHHAVGTPLEQTVLTGSTATVNLQLVDALGEAVPFIRNVRVVATGAGSPLLSDGLGGGGTSFDETYQTDASGLATFTVTNATDSVVTLTFYTDGSGAPVASSNLSTTTSTATVTFVANPEPTLSSASNLSFLQGTTANHPVITVRANGGTRLGTSGIRIRIPASLTAIFNATPPNVALTASSGTLGTPVIAGNVLTIPISVALSADAVVTIGSVTPLAYTATNSISTGNLELSYDGGTTYPVADDKLVAVTNTVTWDGSTSTDWATGTNWDTDAPPGTGADVIIADAGAQPTLTMAANTAVRDLLVRTGRTLTVTGAFTLSARNLTIEAGASLVLAGGANLSVSGTLVNNGTFTPAGGTVTMTGTGLLRGLTGASPLNLVIATGAQVTLGSALVVPGNAGTGGNLTINGTGVLDVSASNFAITLDGDWTNNNGTAGFVRRSGTVTFRNSNGDTAHAIGGTGNTDFHSLYSTGAAVQTPTISVTAGRTIGIYGVLTLTGNSNTERITLQSSDFATDFFLALQNGAGHTVSNAAIFNSDLTTSAFAPALAAPSVIGGGNDDLATAPLWGLTATNTWVGGSGTNWGTAANWSLGILPDGAQDVVILDVTNQPVLDADRAVNNLTIALNADIDVGAHALTINGTLSNSGTIYRQGAGTVSKTDNAKGTVHYRNASGNIENYNVAGTPDYFNLILDGAFTFTATSALDVAGTLTVNAAGTTLDLSTFALALTGALTNNGTIRLAGSQTLTLTVGNDTDSGTWVYEGALGGTIRDLGATDYFDLTVAPGSAQDFALEADLVVNGALAVSAGTITVAAPLSITAGSIDLSTGAAYGIDANGQSLTIAAPLNTSLGLGAGAGTVNLTNAELGKIRAAGLTLQASGTGAITVAGVDTSLATHGVLTINGAAGLTFNGSASTFVSGLSATTTSTAANALSVSVSLTSTAGGLALTGGTGNLAISGTPTFSADTGTLSLQASGAGVVNVSTPLILQANLIDQPAETLAMAANALTFRGAEIDFAAGASITGTGNVTIEPLTAAQAIEFNGGGTVAALELTTTDLAAIDAAHGLVTIGRTNGTGTISVLGSPTVPWPLTFEGDNAIPNLVVVGTALTMSGAGEGLTFNAPARLGANISTNGGAITFNQPTRLNAATVTLDTDNVGGATAAGAITFAAAATIDAVTASTHGLVIDTSADGGGAHASSSFGGALGGNAALASLTYTGASVSFPAITAGTLGVVAYGTIGDSGTWTISGATSLETRAAAGSGAILVDQVGPVHSFGDLTLRTRDAANSANVANAITLYENAALSLAAIATAGTTTLVSTGAITDTGTLDLAGGGLILTAAGAITLDDNGVAPATNVIPVLQASAGGSISIDSTGPLVLGGASGVTTSAGTISISTTGAMSTGNSISTTAAGTDIVLTTSSGGITVSHPLTASGAGIVDINSAAGFSLADTVAMVSGTGNITIDTTGANNLAINGDISTGGTGTITLTSGQSIVMDASSSIQTVSGAMVLDADAVAAGSLVLDLVQSTGGGLITLRAGSTGSITEADNTASVATSGILYINDVTQGSSVGSAVVNGALNTAVGTLRLRAAGNVYINEADALVLGDGTAGVTTNGGLISISAGGSVTMGAPLSTTTPAGGAVNLTVTGAGNDLAISQNIQAFNNAAITLNVADRITRSAGIVGATGSTSVLTLIAGGGIGVDGGPDGLADATWLWTDVGAVHTGTGSVTGTSYLYDQSGGITLGGVADYATSTGGLYLSALGGDITTGIAHTSIDGILDLRTAGSIQIVHDLGTASADINFHAPVVVGGNVTLSTGAGVGDITFDSTVTANAATRTLNLDAGTGDVTLAGDSGTAGASADDLLTLTVFSATNINLESVYTHGLQSYTASGTITLGSAGPATYQAMSSAGIESISFAGPTVFANDVSFQTPDATETDVVSFSSILTESGGARNLSIRAGEINFGGNVTGTGNLLLEPATAGQEVILAGTTGSASLELSAAELARLVNGWSDITIGRTDGSGAFSLGAWTISDPVTLQSPVAPGNLSVTGNLATTAASNGSWTFLFGTNTMNLGGNIVTSGEPISLSGSLVLTADVLVDSTSAGTSPAGAAITFSGTINDDAAGGSNRNLIVNAGTGATITFDGTVGGTQDPASLTTRSNDLVVGAGALDVGAGVINFYASPANQVMTIGTDAGSPSGAPDWELFDQELAKLSGYTTLTFGEAGVQSGTITLQTATAPVAAGNVVANSDFGAGAIVLDDQGSATALAIGGAATGNITLNAGTGGITATSTTNGQAELATGGRITLESTGTVGSTTNRIQFPAAQDEVAVIDATAAYLGGLGTLSLGHAAPAGITTTNGIIDVITAAGNLTLTQPLSSGTGAVSLNPAGSIVLAYNGTVITTSTGNITLDSPVLLNQDSTITMTGAPAGTALISFTGSIDSDIAVYRALVVNSGTAYPDVTVTGPIGVTRSLTGLTMAGNDISLGSIGALAIAGVSGTTSVTAHDNGGDNGTISLGGAFYRSSGSQTWAAPATASPSIFFTGASPAMTATTAAASITLDPDSGAVTYTGGTVNLGNGSDLALTTNNGAVTIQGSLTGNSSEDLTVTTGNGTVNLGRVGTVATNQINGVSVSTSGTINLYGDLYVDNNAGNGVTLGSSAATIVLQTDVVMAQNGGSATATFNGSVDSAGTARSLTVSMAGLTDFNGTLGNGTAPDINILTVNGGGSVDLGGSIFADVVNIQDAATLTASITIDDGVATGAALGGDGTAEDVFFASTLQGAFNLSLAGAGRKEFTGNVGTAGTPLGTGTGASLSQTGAGALDFLGTLNTAQGISQTGTGAITFRGDVTIAGGATASNFQNDVTLHDLTFTSAGAVAFGSDGTDTLTLGTGPVTMDGAGDKTFNAVVAGPGITLNQADASGDMDFNENVTIAGGNWEGDVTLGGMTLDTSALLTIGTTAGADTLTLEDAAATLQGNGAYQINASVTGTENLTLSGSGTKTFEDLVGSPDALGTLTQVDGSGELTLRANTTVAAATLNADLTLDSLTFTSAGAVTFGSDAADTVTLSGAAVTVTTAAANQAQTWNAAIEGTYPLTVQTGTANLVFAGPIGITNALTSLTTSSGNLSFTGSTVRTGGTQNYTATTKAVISLGADATWTAGGAVLPAMDIAFVSPWVFLDSPGRTLTLAGNLGISASGALYRGALNLAGNEARVTDDLVILGTGYSPDDGDRALGGGTEFAYTGLTAMTNGGANGLALPGIPSGALTNAAGTGRIKVGRNFYANRATMSAASPWELWLTDMTAISDLSTANTLSTGLGGGTGVANNYALAIAGSVGNSNVRSFATANWAADTGPGYVNAAEGVTADAGSQANGWVVTRPRIRSARTIYDDMVEVVFEASDGTDLALENSNNEISRLVNQTNGTNTVERALNLRFHDGSSSNHRFLGVFVWQDSATLAVPAQELVAGDGDGIWDPAENGTFVAVGAGGALDSVDIPANTRLYFKTSTTEATHGTYRWNTDATGSSAGDARSTDRAGVHQTLVPRLILQKGRVFAANGKTMNDNMGDDGSATYTAATDFDATTDATRPVLVGAWTGRHDDAVASTLATDPYNRHNLLHLRWSEPMDLSALSGSDPAGTATTANAGDETFSGILRSRHTTGTPAQQIAAFKEGDGPTGGVLISGLNLEYGDSSTHFLYGARPHATLAPGNDPATLAEDWREGIHLVYRSSTPSRENPAGAQGLTIFLAGFSVDNGSTRFWPGWLGGSDDGSPDNTQPSGTLRQFASDPAAVIRDASGNPLESYLNPYDGKVGGTTGVTINPNANGAVTLASVSTGGAGFGSGGAMTGLWADAWDVTPPRIPAVGVFRRIYTSLDILGRMEAFQFVSVEEDTSPADGEDDNGAAADGLRDSAWTFPSSAGEAQPYTDELMSFLFNEYGAGSPTNAWNTQIVTSVPIPALIPPYNPVTQPDPDDRFFGINIDPAGAHGWGTISSMEITYRTRWDSTLAVKGAYFTDHAGNILKSSNIATPWPAFERTPPNVQYALASADGRRVFVQFDEPVFRDALAFNPILASDFIIRDGGTDHTPAGLTIIKTETVAISGIGDRTGATQVYLDLPAGLVLTPDKVYTLKILGADDPVDTGTASTVVDKGGTPMQTDRLYRYTNVAIGTVEPVFALNDMVNPATGSGVDALRVFDGSGRLPGDGNITLQVKSLLSAPAQDNTIRMYYDAQVPKSVRASNGEHWLPTGMPGFATVPNADARSLLGTLVANGVHEFSLAPDPEFKTDALVEFILEQAGPGASGTLTAGWVTDPQKPEEVRPWAFQYGAIIDQRAGVSILNNVINPENNDRTILQYKLTQAGNVNIIVFTIDGNIVRVLQRGRQAPGEYRVSWDGRNSQGAVVARGLYLVRVVGPGFDEYRKVLVVRP